jgi:hypothetical protein
MSVPRCREELSLHEVCLDNLTEIINPLVSQTLGVIIPDRCVLTLDQTTTAISRNFGFFLVPLPLASTYSPDLTYPNKTSAPQDQNTSLRDAMSGGQEKHGIRNPDTMFRDTLIRDNSSRHNTDPIPNMTIHDELRVIAHLSSSFIQIILQVDTPES